MLKDEQNKFSKYVAMLILWAYEHGYTLTLGEALRTQEQQNIYIQTGKTARSRSKHQDSLAIDLALFIDGVYQTRTMDYMPLGELWKSLDPECIWGGDWKSFPDGNHFQYGK